MFKEILLVVRTIDEAIISINNSILAGKRIVFVLWVINMNISLYAVHISFCNIKVIYYNPIICIDIVKCIEFNIIEFSVGPNLVKNKMDIPCIHFFGTERLFYHISI